MRNPGGWNAADTKLRIDPRARPHLANMANRPQCSDDGEGEGAMATWMLSRRNVMQGAAVIGTVAATRGVSATKQQTGAVTQLQVERLVSPLTVESARPRLSWRTEEIEQAGYRVLVARDPTRLRPGGADLWDSGAVAVPRHGNVEYGGLPLRSLERAYWCVEVTDLQGRLFRSPVSFWQAGLLREEDWKGDWLNSESEELAGDRKAGLAWIWGDEPGATTPQLFHRAFSLPAVPPEAVLQVVARDALDGVWLNGSPVQRHPFRPGVVNNARMETIILPVRPGENLLTIAASYHPERGPRSPTGGMAALLRLRYGDGRVQRITTRSNWLTAPARMLDGPRGPEPKSAWKLARPAGSRPINDPWPAGPAMLLRRRFAAKLRVLKATLIATALGAYYVHLNGRRVGSALLAPESTDMTRRVLYQGYDVTGMIRPGDNMLGAIVGDGWYGSTGLFGGRFDFGPAPCRFYAQLVIEFEDGSSKTIVTDRRWETAPSPVLSSEIYDGEVYDARRERPGWDLPGAPVEGWSSVSLAAKPQAKLVAQVDPPIRVMRTLKPVSIRQIGRDVHVVDFGQNHAGRCVLSAQARAGTTVTLRFAEIVTASGEIDQSNLRSAAARDIYIFSGTGVETYRPGFTYHGYRFVQVEGWEGPLPDNFLVSEVIHTDLPETGLFSIDDSLVQKLWLNALWSQRSNFVGIPTDCPQRDERLGWMGDAQVFWDAASFNMDVSTFTRRFMGDVRDGQAPSGAFAEYNPHSVHADGKGAPGWSDAGVILPWTVWRRYGDTAIIEENWPAMTAYADYVLRNNGDFIWRHGRGKDYGDWLALDAKSPGDPTTPKDLVATACWANVTDKLAEMADAIDRPRDVQTYRERRIEIGRAFATAFIHPDGSIGNGSQTGYILALRYGLAPERLRSGAAARLVGDIRRRGIVLSTGFLGTPAALDVLLDLGERDLVYRLLKRTDFPSWGYMVAKGATTIWERWNGDTGDVSMNSFNHYALGAIVGFFYRRLAGIDAAAPGFSRVLIAPETRLGFRSAGARFDTSAGRIETRWRRGGDRLALDIAIPPNATGVLRLPVNRTAEALLDGKLYRAAANGTIEAELSSGSHHLTIG